MNATTKTYLQFRASGYSASHALHGAKAKLAFEALERRELVRLRAEPEEENYFDVYGEPEGYEGANGRRVSAEQERKETCELLERDGCWHVVAEYFDGQRWQHADSIGMNTGYKNVLSPFENCYVPDLMASAVEMAEAYIDEMAEAV